MLVLSYIKYSGWIILFCVILLKLFIPRNLYVSPLDLLNFVGMLSVTILTLYVHFLVIIYSLQTPMLGRTSTQITKNSKQHLTKSATYKRQLKFMF